MTGDIFAIASEAIVTRNTNSLKTAAEKMAAMARLDPAYVEPLMVLADHLAWRDTPAALNALCIAVQLAPADSQHQQQAVALILKYVDTLAITDLNRAVDAAEFASSFATPGTPLELEAIRTERDLRAGRVRRPSLSTQARDFVRRFALGEQ